MGNFQYKTSSAGSWIDVPATAYHGTYAGTAEVIYPMAQDKTGMGRPCAAIGEPKIKINSTIMTASGMKFWQDFFSGVDAVDDEVWFTAKDPRDNNWHYYTGWLLRPTYSRVQIGTGSLNTMYFDNEIIIDLVVETT